MIAKRLGNDRRISARIRMLIYMVNVKYLQHKRRHYQLKNVSVMKDLKKIKEAIKITYDVLDVLRPQHVVALTRVSSIKGKRTE